MFEQSRIITFDVPETWRCYCLERSKCCAWPRSKNLYRLNALRTRILLCLPQRSIDPLTLKQRAGSSFFWKGERKKKKRNAFEKGIREVSDSKFLCVRKWMKSSDEFSDRKEGRTYLFSVCKSRRAVVRCRSSLVENASWTFTWFTFPTRSNSRWTTLSPLKSAPFSNRK